MELSLHGERAFCVFVRFERIYSACGYRLTHGLAPQQADAEPIYCFNVTDSWSMPLSSNFIILQKDVGSSTYTNQYFLVLIWKADGIPAERPRKFLRRPAQTFLDFRIRLHLRFR